MQKILLITLGRLKEDYYRAAAAEYQKRLSGYCSFTELSLEPVRLSDHPSDAAIAAALEKEAGMIFEKLPRNCYKVALCVEGKQLTSELLAEKIKENAAFGGGQMAFIIGSSFGLSERVKQACDLRLSMSAMTFPHRLAQIMLLEQLYRGFTILSGSRYHK